MELDKFNNAENNEIQNVIISKIRDLIKYKNLEPGDKLPSERILSEKFGVSRRNISEAIEKLEFYGLLKSIAHTGTFIADIGQTAMIGILDDMITLDHQNFKSLVETRIMLEIKTAILASKRRSDKDLENIEQALTNFKLKLLKGEEATQEDLLFHLAIAKASRNGTINEMMLRITPKILRVLDETKICDEDHVKSEIKNHEAIFEAIKMQDSKLAIEAMEHHFKVLVEFCNNFD
ncbi:FadR/GntR family transcriptional regulator [Mariniflexile sp.]|uniref:FadR/GntR family transcriptional regulator n=1 Tax=Mariniflexile sp. TaxID=1979402 RepID=UPI003562F72B